jgi:hypothetical protein
MSKTVKELIQDLQKFDENTIVSIAGYEGGFKDIGGSYEKELYLNVNTEWYYGEHDDRLPYIKPDKEYKKEKRIIIA